MFISLEDLWERWFGRSLPNLIRWEIVGVEDVEADASDHQSGVDRHGHPPKLPFVASHVEVSQNADANQETSDAATQMSDVSYTVIGVVEVAINRESDVGAAENQENEELHNRVLHLVPVHDNRGNVGSN